MKFVFTVYTVRKIDKNLFEIKQKRTHFKIEQIFVQNQTKKFHPEIAQKFV
jgi:hypothetical protein